MMVKLTQRKKILGVALVARGGHQILNGSLNEWWLGVADAV